MITAFAACLLTWAAHAADRVPLNGAGGGIVVEDETRLVVQAETGEIVFDFAPVLQPHATRWRFAALICGEASCLRGFARFDNPLNALDTRLAAFDAGLSPSTSLVVERGFDHRSSIALLAQDQALLLNRNSTRFAHPGACGTRACQALGPALSLLVRDEAGRWRPERPLRAYRVDDEELRLISAGELEPGPLVIQEITDAGVSWVRVDAELQPTRLSLPAGRIHDVGGGRLLVNFEAGDPARLPQADVLGLLPASCLETGCGEEALARFTDLSRVDNRRQTLFSREGRLFVVRAESGADQLLVWDNGRFHPVDTPFDDHELSLMVWISAAGVGLISERYDERRTLSHLRVDNEGVTVEPLVTRGQGANADVERVHAEARDGESILIRLVSPQGRAQACAATLVRAYGGFGLASPPRSLTGIERAWLEAGGRLAFVHVRGDAAVSADWARAGEQDRWLTIHDLADAVTALQERGLSAPENTVLSGGSFGAVLALAAAAELGESVALTYAASTPHRGGDDFAGAVTAYLELDPPFDHTAPHSPVVFSASNADRVVSPNEARIWTRAVEDAGGTARLVVFDDLPHAWRRLDHPSVDAAHARLFDLADDAISACEASWR
ncbi:MAG: prolyl oligopeptidase family serine peptidase [Pseudomonadota bacterium]